MPVPNNIQYLCGCTWDITRSPEMAYLKDETEINRLTLSVSRYAKDAGNPKESALAQDSIDKLALISTPKESTAKYTSTPADIISDPQKAYSDVLYETIPTPQLKCPRHKENVLFSYFFDPALRLVP